MSPAERAFVARLQRRAASMAPETARRYLEAYRQIRDVLTEAELARAIRAGHLDALLTELLDGQSELPALRSLRLRLDQALIDGARAETRQLPSFLRIGLFDTLNPSVVQAARLFDGAAMRVLRTEVREVITQEATRGLTEGVNPRRIARGMRDAVGLAPNQAQWVANFRAQLEAGDPAALRRVLGKGQIQLPDGSRIVRQGHAAGQGLSKAQLATLEKLLRNGEPIPAQQVDVMVEAYRKRLRALNTEAHTRTQMLQAQKLGQRAAWEDAIAQGTVARSALRRTWLAVAGPTGDGRNRAEHLELHGMTVGFDDMFPNGQLVPGENDYNCRCLARTWLDLKAARAAA